jgi:predicted metal-dependent phosphotriesterase family hydrolase
MHEHVFTIGTEIRENWPNYPDPWDEEERVTDPIAKLREIKEHGFDLIVDPTVVGLGRATHIPRGVLPVLGERGVTDEQITTMLVENPRRFFAAGVRA